MTDLNLTKEESIFLNKAVKEAKKEILRNRALNKLSVKSAWMSIPVYCEVVKIDGDRVKVLDEYQAYHWYNIEDFINRHTFYG